MKHVIKKLTALVLAALLVLSLGVSAWATEGTETARKVQLTNETATITIDDVKADETAVVYQLVSYNDTYTNYEFESNFKTFLETKAGKTGDQQNDIATYFAKQSAPDTTKLIEEFVILCNTAGSGYACPAEYSRTLAAGTSADVQVEPGYYMIIMETSVNASRIYQPITVFVRVDADKLHIYTGGSAAPITYANASTKKEHVTEPASTMVFNYAMNLQKQSDRSVPLFGAKFTFYVDEEMTRLVYFVPVGTEDQKMYRVGKAEDAGAITEIPADFTLVGGSTGTVYFKETTVPTGYFAPAGGFKLVLASEVSGVTTQHTGNLRSNGTDPSALIPLNENDKDLILTSAIVTDTPHIYRVILRNSTTPVLPSTGGVGTVMFTVGGIAVMVLAAFLFLRRKNKEN